MNIRLVLSSVFLVHSASAVDMCKYFKCHHNNRNLSLRGSSGEPSNLQEPPSSGGRNPFPNLAVDPKDADQGSLVQRALENQHQEE